MAYRDGRTRGKKNLRKMNDGRLMNQHGVIFSPEEKKALERKVNNLNAKRNRALKKLDSTEVLEAGVPQGYTNAQLRLMGQENDFILAKRTKSLQRFQSKEQFNKYMKSLDKANSPDYLYHRAKQYKANYLESLKELTNEKNDVYNKIRAMPPEIFADIAKNDSAFTLGFLYSREEVDAKNEKLRSALERYKPQIQEMRRNLPRLQKGK